MKKQLKIIYISFFLLCNNFLLLAQPDQENSTDDLESADPDTVPITDYLWILVLVGLIYVFIRLQSLSKQKNSEKFTN